MRSLLEAPGQGVKLHLCSFELLFKASDRFLLGLAQDLPGELQPLPAGFIRRRNALPQTFGQLLLLGLEVFYFTAYAFRVLAAA
ncbi:hypothetical protein SBV1_360013 [Verrucomicrobia bacterium]|nr:hypothetical protein SBV1_360013 [Verrucomicrobiota bacterium]